MELLHISYFKRAADLLFNPLRENIVLARCLRCCLLLRGRDKLKCECGENPVFFIK